MIVWLISIFPECIKKDKKDIRDNIVDHKLYEDTDQVHFILQNNTNTQFGSTLFC